MKSRILSLLLLLLPALMIYTGCKKANEIPATGAGELKGGAGAITIAVISDLHYMAPELLVEDGPAFQANLISDPKLVQYSPEIIAQAIAQINRDHPDLLLIPGDLTKDGEAISHEQLLTLLHEKLDKNIRVMVVPGNHDIANPDAAYYDGATTTPAESITAEEFVQMYGDYGYGQAISRDEHSLSYVAEPYKNLRVIGIDATEPPSQDDPTTNGYLKEETMEWIAQQVAEAEGKHMQVIAFMHHQLVPHHQLETMMTPGYVLDNWQESANFLTNQGLQVLFTGHYHSHDITSFTNASGTIYDISTGSAVTYPLPYRLVKYQNNNKIDLETRYISGISIEGVPLQQYSKSFDEEYWSAYFYAAIMYELSAAPPDLRTQLATEGTPLMRNSLLAHHYGDENIPADELAALIDFRDNCPIPSFGMQLYAFSMSFWTDLPVYHDITFHTTLP